MTPQAQGRHYRADEPRKKQEQPRDESPQSTPNGVEKKRTRCDAALSKMSADRTSLQRRKTRS